MKDYEAHVRRSMNRVYEEARKSAQAIEDIEKVRWIIFSDHHRGQDDGADDFKDCRSIYHAALGYYLSAGYTLLLLGDVEELWECFPTRVLRTYRDTLALEKRFAAENPSRCQRIYGNHDDLWSHPDKVRSQLEPFILADHVSEGLVFTVRAGGEEKAIFLTHGHQGNLFNDRLRAISRFFVRLVWRNLQRLLHFGSTTAASDYEIRGLQEKALYEWAKENHVLLIAGDTHHPVFASSVHQDDIQSQIENKSKKLGQTEEPKAKRKLEEEIAYLNADLEWIKSRSGSYEQEWLDLQESLKPNYFNSGACSFSDGDITGIEISEGEIRLVRWPDDNGSPRRKVIKSAKIGSILARC